MTFLQISGDVVEETCLTVYTAEYSFRGLHFNLSTQEPVVHQQTDYSFNLTKPDGNLSLKLSVMGMSVLVKLKLSVLRCLCDHVRVLVHVMF